MPPPQKRNGGNLQTKERNDLLAVQNLRYPHKLVKATDKTSTEVETTKTEDHMVQFEEAFDM